MTDVNLGTTHPDVYRRVLALDRAVAEAATAAGLDPRLVELVKIRVSQLNGCAFCLRMHTRDALAAGETTDRLAVLPAWWESQYFSAPERAALALAEEVTALAPTGRTAPAEGTLTDEQVSVVTWLAILMGTWNRIAIRSHYGVAPEAGTGTQATA